MNGRKQPAKKKPLLFSAFFQDLKKGEKVAVVREESLQPRFPTNLQGRTGIVTGKKGKAYLVSIKDQRKAKEYIIEPIHLKKIQSIQKQ